MGIPYENGMFRIKDMLRDKKLMALDIDFLTRIIKRCEILLDIGCGNSRVIKLVQEKNKANELVGIDIGNTYNGHDFLFIKGDGQTLPFKSEAFDCVVCSHLLEHLPQPENCVVEMKRILKKGGRVYILVPKELFRGSSIFLFDSLLLFLSTKKWVSSRHLHLHRFTKNKLLDLFRDFRIVKVLEVRRDILNRKSYLLIAEKR